MYTFLTESRKIKLSLILLIMSLLTIMPIAGVNSAPPHNPNVSIELEGVVNLDHGGMAIDGEVLTLGTQCSSLFGEPPLNETALEWMGTGMKLHRYQISTGSVEQEVHQINQQQNIDCQASPNYLTYLSGYSLFGSPFDGYGANAFPEAIKNQPALSIVDSSSNKTGSGVTVAMFDSFCENSSEDHLLNHGFRGIEFKKGYTTPITTTPSLPVNLCGHGEGVMSMVKSIAPDTHIKLYRVLGDNGFGTLHGLLQALNDFAQRDIPPHTIINLSLGVKGHQVLLLRKVLKELHDEYDVLIVAAAGNEHYGAKPQYPAAYEFVIGAAATNHHGEQTDYANNGDILAPGGDGDCGDTNGNATPANFDCLAVLNSQSPTGASYWKGSSFSAGIVSGVAAALWEANPGLSATGVRGLIP